MLKDVRIVIPSMGRAERQITLEQLPVSVRPNTMLAVPSREAAAYSRWDCALWPVPNTVRGIARTVKWLLENCPTRYFLLLDDDMVFFKREDMASPKLTAIKGISMTPMFGYWLSLMGKYVHVGLSARQGNNRVNEPYKECSRLYNAYCYDVPKLLAAKPQLGRMEVMEDFDLTLQLLRAGLPNAMIYKYCWNQPSSNLPGGCSAYRNNEMQARSAHKLAALHPGFVKVVTKQSNNWRDMATRTDVVVYWKKAYESSKT